MNDIRTLEDAVVDILRECTETRSSDSVLYAELMTHINRDARNMPFAYVITHMDELGLPPITSVSRARRKAQEIHSELQSNDRVRSYRKHLAREFEDYARDKNER